MARKPEIQYIRYYTDGTAARQPEQKPAPPKRKPLPQKKRRPRYIVRVQPLAVCGVMISVVLMVMMIMGASAYFAAQNQLQEMEYYVGALKVSNEMLREEYEAGIDLQKIEAAALALGMVPESQVQHVTISVPMPEPQADASIWDSITTFLAACLHKTANGQ